MKTLQTLLTALCLVALVPSESDACSPALAENWALLEAGDTAVPLNPTLVLVAGDCAQLNCQQSVFILHPEGSDTPVPCTATWEEGSHGLWGIYSQATLTLQPEVDLEPQTTYTLSSEGDTALSWVDGTPFSASFTTGDTRDDEISVLDEDAVSVSAHLEPTDNFCHGDYYSYTVNLPQAPEPGSFWIFFEREEQMTSLLGAVVRADTEAPKEIRIELSPSEAESLPTPLAPCVTITLLDRAGHHSNPAQHCVSAEPDPAHESDTATEEEDTQASETTNAEGSDDVGPTEETDASFEVSDDAANAEEELGTPDSEASEESGCGTARGLTGWWTLFAALWAFVAWRRRLFLIHLWHNSP